MSERPPRNPLGDPSGPTRRQLAQLNRRKTRTDQPVRRQQRDSESEAEAKARAKEQLLKQIEDDSITKDDIVVRREGGQIIAQLSDEAIKQRAAEKYEGLSAADFTVVSTENGRTVKLADDAVTPDQERAVLKALAARSDKIAVTSQGDGPALTPAESAQSASDFQNALRTLFSGLESYDYSDITYNNYGSSDVTAELVNPANAVANAESLSQSRQEVLKEIDSQIDTTFKSDLERGVDYKVIKENGKLKPKLTDQYRNQRKQERRQELRKKAAAQSSLYDPADFKINKQDGKLVATVPLGRQLEEQRVNIAADVAKSDLSFVSDVVKKLDLTKKQDTAVSLELSDLSTPNQSVRKGGFNFSEIPGSKVKQAVGQAAINQGFLGADSDVVMEAYSAVKEGLTESQRSQAQVEFSEASTEGRPIDLSALPTPLQKRLQNNYLESAPKEISQSIQVAELEERFGQDIQPGADVTFDGAVPELTRSFVTKQVEQNLETKFDQELKRRQDFVISEGGTPQLTDQFQREQAIQSAEQQLENQFNTDLSQGADFTVSQTDDGYQASLTNQFQRQQAAPEFAQFSAAELQVTGEGKNQTIRPTKSARKAEIENEPFSLNFIEQQTGQDIDDPQTDVAASDPRQAAQQLFQAGVLSQGQVDDVTSAFNAQPVDVEQARQALFGQSSPLASGDGAHALLADQFKERAQSGGELTRGEFRPLLADVQKFRSQTPDKEIEPNSGDDEGGGDAGGGGGGGQNPIEIERGPNAPSVAEQIGGAGPASVAQDDKGSANGSGGASSGAGSSSSDNSDSDGTQSVVDEIADIVTGRDQNNIPGQQSTADSDGQTQSDTEEDVGDDFVTSRQERLRGKEKTGKGPFPDKGPAGSNPNVKLGDVNLPDAKRGDATDELADGQLTRSEVAAETESFEPPGSSQAELLEGPLGTDPSRQDVPGVEQKSGRVALQARRVEKRFLNQSEQLSVQQDVRVIRENGKLATRLTPQGQDKLSKQAAKGTQFSPAGIDVSATGELSLTEQGRATQAREQVEAIGRNVARLFQPAAKDARLATSVLVQSAQAQASAEQQVTEQATQQAKRKFGSSFERGEDFEVNTSVENGRVTADVGLTRSGRTEVAEQQVREQFPGVDLDRGRDYTIDRDPQGFEIQLTDQGEQKVKESRSGERFGDIPAIDVGAIGGGVKGALTSPNNPGLGAAAGAVEGRGTKIKVDDELRELGADITNITAKPAGNVADQLVTRTVRGGAAIKRLLEGRNASQLSESTITLSNTAGDTAGNTVQSAIDIFNPAKRGAGLIEGGEFVVAGAKAQATPQDEQFDERAVSAGEQAVGQFATQFKKQPFRTSGMLVGSLVGSYAGIAGASRLSGKAGAVARYTAQPGEELVGLAGNQALARTGSAITKIGRAVPEGRVSSGVKRVGGSVEGSSSKLFPDNEPVFMSEETGIRVAKSVGRRLGRSASKLRSGDVELQGTPRQQQIVESLRPGEAGATIEESVEAPSGGQETVQVEDAPAPATQLLSEGITQADPRAVSLGSAESEFETRSRLPRGEGATPEISQDETTDVAADQSENALTLEALLGEQEAAAYRSRKEARLEREGTEQQESAAEQPEQPEQPQQSVESPTRQPEETPTEIETTQLPLEGTETTEAEFPEAPTDATQDLGTSPEATLDQFYDPAGRLGRRLRASVRGDEATLGSTDTSVQTGETSVDVATRQGGVRRDKLFDLTGETDENALTLEALVGPEQAAEFREEKETGSNQAVADLATRGFAEAEASTVETGDETIETGTVQGETTPEQRIVQQTLNQRARFESGVFEAADVRSRLPSLQQQAARLRFGEEGQLLKQQEIQTEEETGPELDPTQDRVIRADRFSQEVDITKEAKELRRQAESTFKLESDVKSELERRLERAQESEVRTDTELESGAENRLEAAQEREARLDQKSRFEARTEPRVGPLAETSPDVTPQSVYNQTITQTVPGIQEREIQYQGQDVDTIQEPDTEQELEQELNQPFEPEFNPNPETEDEPEDEFEAEAEVKTENEAEVFQQQEGPATQGDEQFDFSGVAEGQITNFLNPLTGEVIKTNPSANPTVSDLFKPN